MNGNTERTPAMRSALLAASFARWQEMEHKYPVVAPPAAQRALPLSLGRARSTLKSAWSAGDIGRETCLCVEHMLRRCEHPEHQMLFDAHSVSDRSGEWVSLAQQSAERFALQSKDTLDPRVGPWVDTDIEFDSRTYATTVTVYSAFTQVDAEAAREFIRVAEPANWQSRSDFFKQSEPGTWNPAAGIFVPGPRPGPNDNYQILERAEWEWSPEVTGGVINILDITKYNPSDDDWQKLALDVLSNLAEENNDPKIKETYAAVQSGAYSLWGASKINYKYGLFRCLQSRFLASWESGGLTEDDGIYHAIWLPSQTEPTGLLCIKITKTLLFSRQADAIEDYSKLLNLLAPSLVSLLMEELAFNGVDKFLKDYQPTGNGATAT